jgi:hypothetical protein
MLLLWVLCDVMPSKDRVRRNAFVERDHLTAIPLTPTPLGRIKTGHRTDSVRGKSPLYPSPSPLAAIRLSHPGDASGVDVR